MKPPEPWSVRLYCFRLSLVSRCLVAQPPWNLARGRAADKVSRRCSRISRAGSGIPATSVPWRESQVPCRRHALRLGFWVMFHVKPTVRPTVAICHEHVGRRLPIPTRANRRSGGVCAWGSALPLQSTPLSKLNRLRDGARFTTVYSHPAVGSTPSLRCSETKIPVTRADCSRVPPKTAKDARGRPSQRVCALYCYLGFTTTTRNGSSPSL